MIKGAIFDADGTLLDSMHLWENAGSEFLMSMGISPDNNISKIIFSMSLEESSAFIKKQYNLALTPQEIKSKILSIVDNGYRCEVQTKTGVESFLEQLRQKNIPMVVATTANAEQVDSALTRLKIRSYFSRIFTCSQLNTNKKQPLIYQKSSEFLHTKPEETVVFEDAIHALRSASNAGFKTVAIEDFASKTNNNEIKKIANLCMEDFSDFNSFWKSVSEI